MTGTVTRTWGRNYLAPGVYRRPVRAERPDVRIVRPDVAAFLGYVERVPTSADERMVRVTSWKEYVTRFGGFLAYGYLPHAVRGFFENGGRACWIVPVTARVPIKDGETPAPARPAAVVLTGRDEKKAKESLKLQSDAKAGDSQLGIQGNSTLVAGDYVRVEHLRFAELLRVRAREGQTLHVEKAVSAKFPEGAVLKPMAPLLWIEALRAGSWGNRLHYRLRTLPTGEAGKEFSLHVQLAATTPGQPPVEEEFFDRLSLSPKSDFFAVERIRRLSNLIRVEVPKDDDDKYVDGRFLDAKGDLRSAGVELETELPILGADARANVRPTDFIESLQRLEEIDEVSILCAPDVVLERLPMPRFPPVVHDPCKKPERVRPAPLPVEDLHIDPPEFSAADRIRIYRAMIEHCERLRDRVVLIDPPPRPKEDAEKELVDLTDWQKQVMEWRKLFQTRFAALYFPWLRVPDEQNWPELTREVPPSGHVAGVYARIDNEFGVHRPPANAALSFVTDLVEDVTAAQQEELNPNSVNAIRSFQGRGIRVWGARSLAARTDSEWRFIHVRRLMSMIQESIEDSMQWAVFEPNNFDLRQTLVHSLDVFLEAIWRQGGLQGATPAEGFFVKCDDTNNPPAVVDAGRLVCQIGVAVAAPMEFICFELRHEPGGSQVVEV